MLINKYIYKFWDMINGFLVINLNEEVTEIISYENGALTIYKKNHY